MHLNLSHGENRKGFRSLTGILTDGGPGSLRPEPWLRGRLDWYIGSRMGPRPSLTRAMPAETVILPGSFERAMWPDADETQHLLHRVAQADASATDELWERHRPALRRMIGLRLDQALSRRVDASDIVQDVLLKASQRLGEYL